MAKHPQKAQPSEPATKKQRIAKHIAKASASKAKNASKPAPPAPKHVEIPTVSAKAKGKEKATEARPPTPPIKSQSKAKSSSKSKPKENAPRVLPTTFKVIAGSYEKLLYGLEGTTTVDENSNVEFHLKPEFIFPAHVSCIKAVAASPEGGKWLATGSADEIIKVWDLRRKKEIGGLMHHEGSVTHLSFPSRSHLLSASEDGTLCLFRARDWSVLRALRGHKGRVNSVAVHPSGKVALSVGKDKTLRMWDLMRGKGSASTKLGKEGEMVRWSIDGSLFAVQAGSTIDLYNTEMTLLHTITHPSRLHDILFCKRVEGDGDLLFAAAEDKKLSVYDVSTDPEKVPNVIAEMIGHENRVKAVQTLDIVLPPSSSGRLSTTIVCTASSDGKIHLYDVAALPTAPSNPSEGQKPVEISPLVAYDSKGTRLTCLTLGDGELDKSGAPVNGKRKRDSGNVGSGEESDEDGDDDDDDDDDEIGWAEEVDGTEEESEQEQEGEEEEEGEEDSD